MPSKTWNGPVPSRCQTCGQPITNIFYDAVTLDGQWALMCHDCQVLGPGQDMLGVGLGQRYQKIDGGPFVKTS